MTARNDAVRDLGQPANERFVPRTDAVTFEVLRHRLWQINDEQGKTIISVSGSPVASEGNDFNVALTDRDGKIIAVGPYIILHVSAITLIVHNAIKLFGEGGIAEGDMYLTNDPWLGSGHQNDVCVIQPVFWAGERIAWTASVIHQVDVGGPYPGSWNPVAKSVFDEAPRYRLLKIVSRGVLQEEVAQTYFTNSRLPNLVELDLRAQIAAANVARDRLHDLIRRYGPGVVRDSLADSLDYSQALFKRRLRSLPDGQWYAEDHLDHDGHEERVYTVKCRLTKSGETLHFDYRGTSAQAPGFINSTESGALAGTYSAVFPYLCGDIPWNAGVLRQIEVHVEEGTVHNAKFPAPVGFGVVHASWTTTNAAALAIGKLLTSSDDARTGAMAVWSGSCFVYNIFGEAQSGERFATMLINSDLQGCGARSFGDGYDVGGKLGAPRAKIADIESIEANYPILYLYRRRVPDSGGAGRWRGGVAAEVAFTPWYARKIDLTVNTLGTSVSSTNGLSGGYPGGGATVMLKRRSNIASLWRQGRLACSVADLSGEMAMLPAKCALSLGEGDVFVAVPHGGGGIGDPLDRDPLLVRRDVLEGTVTQDAASGMYGVVLTVENAVDEVATRRTRSRLLEVRRRESAPAQRRAPAERAAPVDRPIAMGAFLVRRAGVYCSGCGHHLSERNKDIKPYLRKQRQTLAAAGPWVARRWQGDSPFFELWRYFCPYCVKLVAVEQHLRDDVEHWNDYQLSPSSAEG